MIKNIKYFTLLLFIVLLSIYGCGRKLEIDQTNLAILPRILFTYPANNAIGVPQNTSITATFSKNMNASTINTATFTVRNSAGTAVSGAVDYFESVKTARFSPLSEITVNTLYIATIASTIEDTEGNAMRTDYIWSYRTTGEADITPPSVLSVYPANGAADITREAVISARFSEDLNAATVSSDSFSVSSSGAKIDFKSLYYDYSDRTAYFEPYDLVPGQNYEAKLTTQIKDLAGNALTSDYIWNFTITLAPYSWVDTYGGTIGNDYGNAIAVDGSGNFYVIGSVQVTGEGLNIWVRKYNSGGSVAWTKTFNGSANRDDYGKGIGVDSGGNVYAGGVETLSDGKANVWVRKYDTAGNTIWTQPYAMNTTSADDLANMAVDASGNVYLVSQLTTAFPYLWVRKLDTNGNTLWTDSSLNTGVYECGITADGSGNVYVIFGSSLGGLWSIRVRKYDNVGTLLWTDICTSESGGSDYGYDIAVDTDGSVYAVGSIYVGSPGWNTWIRKYNSGGSILWTKSEHYTDSAIYTSAARGIAIDGSHNIYVAGNEGSISWIRKFNSSGSELWALGGTTTSSNWKRDISLDGSANVYTIGMDRWGGTYVKIWVGKYIP